jgi:hypothetical protein
MYQITEFARQGTQPLFTSDEDRRYLMNHANRLACRWGVRMRAFRLGTRWAAILAEGEPDDLGNWGRLVQSGYGVWRYHRLDPIQWLDAVRVRVPDEPTARRVADTLHRGLEPDPLLIPWSSLRDALGLRRAPWFDGEWLMQRGAVAVYEAAGGTRLPERAALSKPYGGWGSLPARDPWPQLGAAIAAATGRDPDGRGLKALRVQVAWARGWSLGEVAETLGVQLNAVRRALRKDLREDVDRALLHLEESRLRFTLGPDAAGSIKGWDLPEPPWSSLHNSSRKPALSYRGA